MGIDDGWVEGCLEGMEVGSSLGWTDGDEVDCVEGRALG